MPRKPRSHRAAASVRRREAETATVPTFPSQLDAEAIRKADDQEAADQDPAAEAVRRMVEAAYT